MSDLDKDILEAEANIESLKSKLSNVENNIKNLDHLRNGESSDNYSNSGYEENLKRGNYEKANELTKEIHKEQTKLDQLKLEKKEISQSTNTKPNTQQQKIDNESSSAGQVCEKCKYAGVTCLCDVTFTNLINNEEFYWRGGNGKLSKPGATVVGADIDSKPFQLKYNIVNSCCKKEPYDRCTKLYYYEEAPNDPVVGQFHKHEQSGELSLKFNNDYIDKPKAMLNQETKEDGQEKKVPIPYYLTVDTSKENIIYSKQKLDQTVVGIKPGTLGEFKGDASKSTLKLDILELQHTRQFNRVMYLLARTMSFAAKSSYDYMPITAYHVSVQECQDGDMSNIPTILDIPPSSLSEKTKSISALSHYDQAVANVLVMPKYKVEYLIKLGFKSIDLSEMQEKLNSHIGEDTVKALENAVDEITSDFSGDAGYLGHKVHADRLPGLMDKHLKKISLVRLIKELGSNLQFSLKIKETFNDKDGDEINLDLEKLYKEAKSFKSLCDLISKDKISAFQLYADAYASTMEFLENFKDTFATIEAAKDALPGAIESLPDEDIFSLSEVNLPLFTFEGTNELIRKGDDLEIERKDTKLSLDPIFGGKISINLALALIKAVPPIREVYDSARGLCALVNSTGVVHARVATELKKSKAVAAAEKKANISAELVIYCQLKIGANARTQADYKDTRLDDPPLLKPSLAELDFDVELEAGACFRLRIFIIQGGASVGVHFKTGISFGWKNSVITDAQGESKYEGSWYTYFKGVDAIWTAEISIGLVKIDEKGAASGEGTKFGVKTQDTPSTAAPTVGSGYHNLDSAQARLKELDGLKPQWESARKIADKKIRDEVEKESLKIKQDYGSLEQESYINTSMSIRQGEIDTLASSMVPNYSHIEHENLTGWFKNQSWLGSTNHIKVYQEHQTDLDRLAIVNKNLNSNINPASRQSLFRERFEIMERIHDDVAGSKLPLKPGDYYQDPVTESEWRKEYDKMLEEDLKKANGHQQSAIDEERKKMEKSNPDGGRDTIMNDKLWGAYNLSGVERDKLQKELLARQQTKIKEQRASEGLKKQ